MSLFDPQSWMLITDYYLPHFSYFVNEFYCYNFDLIYFMLSGKLEFDLHSVLLHAGRVKLILVQAVKVRVRGRTDSVAGR